MTENERYKEETAHLTADQKLLYDYVENFLMGVSQSNTAFINGMIAIEALAKTMRMSHTTWSKRCH